MTGLPLLIFKMLNPWLASIIEHFSQ